MRAMTTISVETDRIVPRSIRKERILCARRVSSATLTGSRRNIRRFIYHIRLGIVLIRRQSFTTVSATEKGIGTPVPS